MTKDRFGDVLRALKEAAKRSAEGGSDHESHDGPSYADISAFSEKERELKEKISDAEMIRNLKTGYALFNSPQEFKPGDIIRGKKELTAYIIKFWDRPHIVLEILPEPLTLSLTAAEASECTSCKRYDMVIGSTTFGKDPAFMLRFYADHRDWELFPEADKLGKADQ